MKIEAITLRELKMPLVHFFETSFGRTYTRRILLVTVHSDGPEGWGECVAGEEPYYSEEYIDGAWDVIVRYLGAILLGQTICRRAGKCRHCWPRCASIAWRRPRWKTRFGTPRRRRRACRCGSCSAASGARSPVGSASASRTRTNSYWRRSKPSWRLATSASR